MFIRQYALIPRGIQSLKYTSGTLTIKNKDKSDIPTNILHRVRLFISIVDNIELWRNLSRHRTSATITPQSSTNKINMWDSRVELRVHYATCRSLAYQIGELMANQHSFDLSTLAAGKLNDMVAAMIEQLGETED